MSMATKMFVPPAPGAGEPGAGEPGAGTPGDGSRLGVPELDSGADVDSVLANGSGKLEVEGLLESCTTDESMFVADEVGVGAENAGGGRASSADVVGPWLTGAAEFAASTGISAETDNEVGAENAGGGKASSAELAIGA